MHNEEPSCNKHDILERILTLLLTNGALYYI